MITYAVTASDKTTRAEPGIEFVTLRSAQVDDCIDTSGRSQFYTCNLFSMQVISNFFILP